MAKDEAPTTFMLNPRNLVGMIERELKELGAYLSQPSEEIDRAVVMYYLQQAFNVTQMLPDLGKIHAPANGGKGEKRVAN